MRTKLLKSCLVFSSTARSTLSVRATLFPFLKETLVFPQILQPQIMKYPLVSTRKILSRLPAIVPARFLLATACLLLPARVFAAFGVTNNGGLLTVDTGAGLVYQVNRGGDIPSIKLNGNELNLTNQSSCVNSGFGATSVTVGPVIGGNRIMITCVNGDSIHYYLVRSGQNIIYMATFAGHDTEWRFIPRLQNAKFKVVPAASDYTPGGTAIESEDTIRLANGDTVSKFYGNAQMRNDVSHGVSGTAGTAVMWMGNRETSSGGPFFRDIQTSAGSTGSNPYNYMKSGHAQTESWRRGLHGVYALSFGGTPDLGSIWDPMGMTGYVPVSGRGQVNASLSGGDFVGYSNASAQYWSGPGLSLFMKPGTYTMTLYKGELAVATSSVTVTARATVNKSISSTFPFPPTIWRLGTWDGTPSEFMNAANVLRMHPSDHRISGWGPKTISSNAPGSWPCYMFRDVNNGCKITFTLSSSQVAAHMVRISITGANAGGRPQIQINSWTSPAPASTAQPNSRVLTIGTYRGNNALFTYAVPASAFVAGNNTLTVNVISGSTSSSPWTGPAVAFDCIELCN